MALILLVEQEARYIERIQDALTAEGWQVMVVSQWAAAVRLAAKESPDLLVVSPEIPGAEGLLSSWSRRSGGPGTIVLVPERDAAGASTKTYGCDEIVVKPAVERELKRAVRRMLLARDPAPPQPAPEKAPDRTLSSQEIFGDVLRELEDGAPPAGAAPARAGSPPPAPPGGARRSSESSAALDRRLEETLSGLLSGSRPGRPAAPAAAGPPDVASKGTAPRAAETTSAGGTAAGAKPGRVRDDVDALLQRTLTDLNWKPGKAPGGGSGSFPNASAPEARPPVTPQAQPPAQSPPTEPPPTEPPLDKTTSRIPGLARFAVAGPKNFGPYTLVERVAVGGMAEVWKATRVGLEGFTKTVAIKRILSHLNDSPEFVNMLINEAKLAALLEHPNITQIYDLGRIGSDHFIAMEFVEGKDLRAVLQAAHARGETMPLGLALLVASRLAGALDHAHRQLDAGGRELRLVHRDVSPQNILFGFAGQIKLCDFGIVKAVSKTNQTQMGALKGKLQYMSPEQAWGRSVDARSDVFSLGAVLFEMVSGRRLFAGSSEVSILEAVRAGRTERLAEVVPEVSRELDELVARALQPLPEDRFQSAGEMQKAIDAVRKNLRPAATEGELRDWIRGLFGLAPAAGEGDFAAAQVLSPLDDLDAPRPETAGTSDAPPPRAAEEAREARSAAQVAAKSALPGWIWVAAVAAVLAIALGVGLSRRGRQPLSVSESPAAQPAAESPWPSETAGGPATASEPASPPEAAASQSAADPDLQRMVDEQFARKEAALREQYEKERQRLEAEIARRRDAQPAAASAVSAPGEKVAAVETEKAAPQPSAPASPEAPVTQAPPPESAPSPPTVETAAPAAPPATQRGDLVRPGPGVVPPSLVSRVEPRYPALARQRRVQATVTAEVLVDENGVISETRLRVDGLDVGFSDAVREALRGARFQPATKDGVPVKMWKVIAFPFRS